MVRCDKNEKIYLTPNEKNLSDIQFSEKYKKGNEWNSEYSKELRSFFKHINNGNDSQPEHKLENKLLRHFTSEEAHDIWWTFISTYLNTEDDALIRKAERHICAVAFARRLFMLVVMPGVLSAEKTETMIRTLMDYYDAGLETIDLGILMRSEACMEQKPESIDIQKMLCNNGLFIAE